MSFGDRVLATWDVNSSVARTRDEGYSTAQFSPVSATNRIEPMFTYALDLKNPLRNPHLKRTERRQHLRSNQVFLYGTECAVHVRS